MSGLSVNLIKEVLNFKESVCDIVQTGKTQHSMEFFMHVLEYGLYEETYGMIIVLTTEKVD